MAAVMEMREPLVTLYPQNSRDLGRQTAKSKFARKSASMGASRAGLAANLEATKPSVVAENYLSRGSTTRSGTPTSEPIAADKLPSTEVVKEQSLRVEDLPAVSNDKPDGVSCADSDFSGDSAMVDHDDRDDQGAVEDELESKSLTQLKMEAMTWAAMAKDYTISSLERRLRTALEIAKAEQDKNQELHRLLHESKEREVATAQELLEAKKQIGQLIEAEERWCAQLGDMEAEAMEEDRRYRTQIATLTERIKAQDQFIAHSLKSLNAGKPAVLQSDSFVSNESSERQSLAAQLDMAKKEIATLHADLNDAKTDLRVSQDFKRNQSRRLKALEKERRYLMRKGAIRSVRLAPRAHKKSETEAPGGAGWKVFSILDFDA